MGVKFLLSNKSDGDLFCHKSSYNNEIYKSAFRIPPATAGGAGQPELKYFAVP